MKPIGKEDEAEEGRHEADRDEDEHAREESDRCEHHEREGELERDGREGAGDELLHRVELAQPRELRPHGRAFGNHQRHAEDRPQRGDAEEELDAGSSVGGEASAQQPQRRIADEHEREAERERLDERRVMHADDAVVDRHAGERDGEGEEVQEPRR
jgi:hypothetical protein